MKVAMIGAGYVGLTTGACLAELGHHVVVHDIDQQRMSDLRAGMVPIYEPGLGDLMDRMLAAGRLGFVADLAGAVADRDLVFICVGTPSLSNGAVDLSYVEAVARSLALLLSPRTILVVKSTVEAGTARHIAGLIASSRGDDLISVASNPEFLREGSAIGDFFKADRIVCGADSPRAAATLSALYEPLVAKGIPLLETSTVDAELSKCAANAFLALKIGFINEVSDLCESTGGDVLAVARAIGLDHRIGGDFLRPGPGFGGSCFPKDTRSFAATGRRLGVTQRLIETLIEGNEARKRQLAGRVLKALGAGAARKTVAVLGTAFKANTDDMREAASLTIIPLLQQAGVLVRGHDPKALDRARAMLPGVVWTQSAYEAAEGADAVIVLTEWEEYARLDLKRLSGQMCGRMLFDFRNLFDPNDVTDHGLIHVALGRSAGNGGSRGARRGGSHPRQDIAAAPA